MCLDIALFNYHKRQGLESVLHEYLFLFGILAYSRATFSSAFFKALIYQKKSSRHLTDGNR